MSDYQAPKKPRGRPAGSANKSKAETVVEAPKPAPWLDMPKPKKPDTWYMVFIKNSSNSGYGVRTVFPTKESAIAYYDSLESEKLGARIFSVAILEEL